MIKMGNLTVEWIKASFCLFHSMIVKFDPKKKIHSKNSSEKVPSEKSSLKRIPGKNPDGNIDA